MTVPLLSPSDPVPSRAEVFLAYLGYFRDRLVTKLEALPEPELRISRVASGWTPIELLTHLRHVERRWLEWGFDGVDVADPWADNKDDRWYVAPDVTLAELVDDLRGQAVRTREVVLSHDLSDVGVPGPRWDGNEPPTLERIMFHLLQEYARHIGHLDIVTELATGNIGE